ncbi:VOC family protein [Candidatus Protochlamydia phocaeensis]|uniref:VOC family protein n=1 Tax=Candidatus Protochlamydia phocaeensis TaxID=1414722 RepID=UPI000837F033|nr:VOC family protein [Candidatus Protochlamydia phocaeensis]
MQFGYTIIYVPDVEEALTFYEKAFGIKRRFIHESLQYGELETGQTRLAFASELLGQTNGVSFRINRKEEPAAGFEIAFVTADVSHSFTRAIQAGAEKVKSPTDMPWGQTIAYVRDLNGVLIEICTSMDE